MYNRFSGDPAIQITENGATMKFIGGQPVMDQGLENAVQISLFTKLGYWGNALVNEESKKIGSKYQRERTIIDVDTVNEVSEDASNALKWMSDTNLLSDININTTNPAGNQLSTSIELFPPGQDSYNFIFTKNGLSWIGQQENPAHERF